jgi:hypothetical protein
LKSLFELVSVRGDLAFLFLAFVFVPIERDSGVRGSRTAAALLKEPACRKRILEGTVAGFALVVGGQRVRQCGVALLLVEVTSCGQVPLTIRSFHLCIRCDGLVHEALVGSLIDSVCHRVKTVLS